MAISTEIVGKTFGPFVRDYTFKDLEICALGCGAGWDGRVDLDYVNEGDAKNPELKVLPIFAVPLTVNEEMTTTLDYGFDYSGSLHYGIDVHFHAPFKMADHIETYVTQEAIWDRGEGRGSLSKQVGSPTLPTVRICARWIRMTAASMMAAGVASSLRRMLSSIPTVSQTSFTRKPMA